MSIYSRLLKESPDLILLTFVLLSIPNAQILGVLFILLILFIHREPDRRTIGVGCDQSVITEFCTAPSYGTVTNVDTIKCSIRSMIGITDIHIQHAPYHGTIKSVTKNDNGAITTTISTDFGDITVIQNGSGLLSKTINFCNVGDKVKRGDQLGFIRFGGYTDIMFPPGTQILVWPDEKINGPNTVIAHLLPKEK